MDWKAARAGFPLDPPDREPDGQIKEPGYGHGV